MGIKIQEVLVVEGRYDKNALRQVVDATIIETSGFGIFRDKEKLALLRRLAEKRGLILLMDSDSAGFVIRSYLRGCIDLSRIKNAYIPDIYGKEKRKSSPSKEGKLGVEGMDPDTLLQALRRAGATFAEENAGQNTEQNNGQTQIQEIRQTQEYRQIQEYGQIQEKAYAEENEHMKENAQTKKQTQTKKQAQTNKNEKNKEKTQIQENRHSASPNRVQSLSQKAITKADMYALGLSGRPESALRRKQFQKKLSLPEKLSASGLLDVLNALYSREEFFSMFTSDPDDPAETPEPADPPA